MNAMNLTSFFILIGVLFPLEIHTATIQMQPHQISNACDSACVVVSINQNVASETTNVLLERLADVSFRNETLVIIGRLPPKVDFDNFWENDNPLLVNGGIVKKDVSKSLFIFKRKKKDLSCLMVPKAPASLPVVIQHTIDSNMKIEHYFGFNKDSDSKKYSLFTSIVKIVNSHCDTFRNVDGSLNFKGLHRNNILEGVFNAGFNQDVRYQHSMQENQCFLNERLPKIYASADTDSDSNISNKILNRQHMKCLAPKKTQATYNDCERISVPSSFTFFDDFLSRSKPVIIEGAMRNWSAFDKWTKDFLKEKYGNIKVHIKATPNGEYEGVESKTKWEKNKNYDIPKTVLDRLPHPDLVVVRPASLDITFSEFLDVIENISNGNLKNFSTYLEYSSIADYFPGLKADISEMEFIKMLHLVNLNIWLSDGNTLGKLHFDPFDNLLCQISGEKHVTLYDPHDNRRLYESHIQEAQFEYNSTSGTFHRSRLLDSTSMVMSPIDLSHPDLKRFPLFADARPLKCSIKPGEILFIPAFWWHEVQSKPDLKERRNLAVNFWYEPFLTKNFPCAECKLDVNPKYFHLL